jgi:hypothetical protein
MQGTKGTFSIPADFLAREGKEEWRWWSVTLLKVAEQLEWHGSSATVLLLLPLPISATCFFYTTK